MNFKKGNLHSFYPRKNISTELPILATISLEHYKETTTVHKSQHTHTRLPLQSPFSTIRSHKESAKEAKRSKKQNTKLPISTLFLFFN